jgi:hypothetical protein
MEKETLQELVWAIPTFLREGIKVEPAVRLNKEDIVDLI